MNPLTPLAVATAPKRDSRHWTASEVTWGEIVSWVDSPADKKEAGNYLLGTLRPDTTVVHKKGEDPCGPNLHRRKDFVISRSAITLDVDNAEKGFADNIEMLFPHALVMHTTWNSTPDAPRYRMIIPTDREMAPDEYVLAAKAVMQEYGADQFDPGTTQPERYMFKPSAKEPKWYSSVVLDGEPLVVDELLADFEEDLSTKPLPKPHRNKRDPFEIDGVIGAFNKAYRDWDLLIETYELPYEKVDEDRYQLAGSRAQAGMGPISEADGFVYSHHSNDPAYGKACSAFDLVRMHRHGYLDEICEPNTPINRLPSHRAMVEEATTDYRVTAQLVGLDFDAVADGQHDDEAWKLQIRRTNNGGFRDVISNWDLISANDPIFKLLCFNELTLAVEATGDLPWRQVTENNAGLTNADRWNVCYHIERTYDFRPTRTFIDGLVDTRAMETIVNPIRDFLNNLVWDQKPRVETCLPGVVPTDFTRLVARKCMVAAVARMLDPGCKWDHTLVLFGPEGLGKSWWIEKMALGYSSDLGHIGDKDTLIAMQRSWIMLADEGQSLRKADHDAQKNFLTRTHDLFRMPYDREVVMHPRHSVIWATTNDEVFLRRQEGNRRFLIVQSEKKVDFDRLTDDYISQVWAEALYLYKAGERLYLEDEDAITSAVERERFVEEDALAGLIQEYLDTLVPEDWWEKSKEGRQRWLDDRANGFEAEGTVRIDVVCSTQLWVEALGRRYGESRRTDLLDITNAMKRIEGWVPAGRQRVPGYGPQLVFTREGTDDDN